MTYDPNFPHMTPYDESLRNNPLHTKVPMTDTESGWSSFIAVASIIFVVGALLFFRPSGTERTMTATNNPQTTTRSTTAPAPTMMPNTGAPTAPLQP